MNHLMKAFVVSCLFLAAVAAVAASDVLPLTPATFDTVVGGDEPVFVKFFAPWCGHCKALAPTWEELAGTFKSKAIKIAEVDCDANKDLCARFDVHGYPTIKFFAATSKTGEAYNGGRTADDLIAFVNQKLGTVVKVKKPQTAVVSLTPETFDAVVMDPTKDVIVKFFAPWCGHCKALAPKYEQAAQSLEGEDSVVVAELDADTYKDLGTKYGVSGFPTLKYFPKDNKNGLDYPGGREAEDFVKFANEHFGTERVVGGGYTEEAGRVPELDALASRFMSETEPEKRAALLSDAHAIIASTTHKNKAFAKVYEFAMKRIQEKGNAFPATEMARLKRMLDSGSVAKTKRGEFAKRVNILAQFKSA